METKVDLDMRYYRRYPKQAQFLLSLKAGVYKAKMVDYSLIGIGIVINDLEAPVSKGDLITLDIDEPDLYAMGKVAWTAKTAFGLRVGIVKTEPFKGRLNVYSLSDILVSLNRTRKTGVLQMRLGTVDKKVFIRKGDIIFAASNYDKDRLGDVLLKNRKINRKQYDRAAEMKRKSGVSYISILLHMGYLNPADIMGVRQRQARRIISSLFLMKDSEFEFVEDILPREDDMIVNLPIADLIYREAKKTADIGLLENYLLERVVDFSSNPLNLFQNLRITAAEKSILAHVNGKRSIGDIVRLSASHKGGNPLKIIYALLEARFLKITEPGDAAPEIRPSMIPVQGDIQQNEFKAAPPSPGTAFTDNINKAKFSFRDGKVAFWDRNFSKAARLFAMAKEFDGSVPEYLYMYGRTLGNLGKNEEAVRALNRANELKPLDPDTLAELGHLYLKLGFPLRAERYFNQVIRIDPSNERAREGIKKTGGRRPR